MQYYMKTGVCKFGEKCKFHHPVDRSAAKPSSQETVKLTLAGLPRREVWIFLFNHFILVIVY